MLGSSNPVAGPYFNFTIPEPTGVVAVVAPDEPPLLGLVSRLAPALIGGNAVVAVASETQPLAAIELAEALATSDVPGGVVNLLTGQRAELAPWLACHMDVNAIDLTGADGLRTDLELAAAENVKRVVLGGRRTVAARDLGVPRAEDRLAPDRHMTAFYQLTDLAPIRIWDGVVARAVGGQEATLAAIELAANAVVPEHAHVNEQIGLLLARVP